MSTQNKRSAPPQEIQIEQKQQNVQDQQLPITAIQIQNNEEVENIQVGIPIGKKLQYTEQEYRGKILLKPLIYGLLFIWIIPLLLNLDGSLAAAYIWIASYLFLILATLMFIDCWKTNLTILRVQIIFLFASWILEVLAFGLSVSQPVLYYYYKNKEYNDIFNDGDYYFDCQQPQQPPLSLEEQEQQYENVCDHMNSTISENHSSQTFQQIYGTNYCTGDYDPYTTYCDSLQFGILAYQILNLLSFIALFIFYMIRIIKFYRSIRREQIIANDSKVNQQSLQNEQIIA